MFSFNCLIFFYYVSFSEREILNFIMSSGRVAARVMRAIQVARFGAPEVMKVESGLPIPEPAVSQVCVTCT